MSTQLIIYPQNYSGYQSTFTFLGVEYIVNGINFSGLSATTLYNTADPYPSEDAILNSPPLIVNTWYRYTTTGAPWGLVAPPIAGAGDLKLFYNAATSGHTGVYQQLSSLTVGQNYDITINITTPVPTGTIALPLALEIWATVSGVTTLEANFLFVPNISQITATFMATTTNDIFLLDYNGDAGILDIADISITESTGTPTGIYTDLADGQVICDVYENEDIPLSLSIDEFKNVAEKVQSYSKSFDLPATKRNNQIFDSIFEITRASTGLNFNPYVKTKCVLKEDGYLLFEGYLRLISIQDKEGEISYSVNLYSEVIALADNLKEKTFRDLNFDELKHLYNYDEIKLSRANSGAGINYTNPSTSGFRDANDTVKYPFVDWTHQYTVSGGNPVLPTLESWFRPFIQLRYLIQRIFASSPFTFTSDFFNTPDFKRLYMDFNWGTDANPNSVQTVGEAFYRQSDPDVYATTSWTNFLWIDDSLPTVAGFNEISSVFTCPAGQENSTFNITYRARAFAQRNGTIEFRWLKNGITVINPSGTHALAGSATAALTIDLLFTLGEITNVDIIDGGYYTSAPTVTIDSMTGSGFNGVALGSFPGPVTGVFIVTGGVFYHNLTSAVEFNGIPQSASSFVYTGTINQILNPTDTLELQWKASNNYIRQQNSPHNNNYSCCLSWSLLTVQISFTGMTGDILLQTLRGELKQWDFLKGIMTMFNLVSMPDPNNPINIIIEPYKDTFISNTAGTNLAARSIQHDWTDKVDVSEMKLTPLTDLNKTTIFKFVEDDDDYAFTNYKNSVGGHLYGSKIVDASTMYNGLETVLDGEDEIVAEPFAATVVKALMADVYADFITPAIYSYNLEDSTSEGFDNSPRIMYNNGLKTLTSCTYTVPDQNNVTGDPAETQFLQFSHLSAIPVGSADADFHFGNCQLLIGGGTLNNLYNTYWSPYIDELYNADTRMMTLKVNLTPADINTFEFTDKVFIKNRVFRVNKINYKPNDLATVEFILIP